MVAGQNKYYCTASDIVRRAYNALNEAPKPEGFEDLTIVVSPEIALESSDLPFIAVDVRAGDQAEGPCTNDGRLMKAQSLITINMRVNILDARNNGVKAIAPLHRWAMRCLFGDKELKAMSMAPIVPAGWQTYGDTHDIGAKGAIQSLVFAHILDLTKAWEEPPQDT